MALVGKQGIIQELAASAFPTMVHERPASSRWSVRPLVWQQIDVVGG
jgi:hypothetical protein